ncbi:MFS transporter, AGZA family, xanthine/uracil permease [Trichoderma gamsii]|uniref:MFS transporter, AGZA family, xanthine/uracil permease n=1 Tax=Trichoderma gamsii TaxID=398673 RepID=A0A2P4ZFX4_9HYPO|nr:MFS transporter, AGZA family, xanthine/uracil permease [Trichoderma gamsii]PON23189.1 MFS transporter, AGZA family, xanthine/uracil permease [Trichoderma gamsii]
MESPTMQPKDSQEPGTLDPRLSSPRLPPAPPVGRSKFCGFRDFVDLVDKWLSGSYLGRLFRLADSGHAKALEGTTFFREIRAGLTTFATMAYIIAVNASILSQTGGTCDCDLKNKFQCDTIPAYADCKEEVRRDLITATAAIAGLASLFFGLLTNLPVALAPGMGLNAYFAYQVVGSNGSGSISYRTALTAVFFEGIIFIFLALTGMRQWLVKLIPTTMKTATGVGIGFLLTEIGLSSSSGIGAITGGSTSTPLALGGCPPDMINPETGACNAGQMTNPTMWLAVFCGGIVTAFLMAFRIKYALVIGVALVSIISWPRNTPVTYFPDTPEGDSRFSFFKQIVAWHPLSKTVNQLDWSLEGTSTSHFILALFTFLYVDIIDATATLYSMVRFCGVVNPKDGDFPRSTIAYCTDATFISIGALFGCSPITAFIESGAGIAEGGRTGLTAVVAGLCFIVSIFFAPIFASIPPWATGCTLILVGCMMIRQVTQVNWRYIGDALPSFIVMTFIPFSYSVAYGLIAGLFVYTILNGLIGLVVFLSNNRIEPREYDLKEYWTWKGSGRPPWFVRAMRRDRSRLSPSSSADDHHDSVPPIAEDNESQRGLNLQQSRENPPGKDGSAAMGEQSVLPTDHDEAYGYPQSSPMRGIAR